MKKSKKFPILVAGIVVASAMSITALAASTYSTPAEAVAGLTGKTVESVIQERADSGKTYGALANESGKLSEFQSELLGMRKAALDAQVAAGTITQERADEIIATMEQNQQNCDGTGSSGNGLHMGARFGKGQAQGQGNGQGRGQGSIKFGQGTCGGSCQIQP
jgi:hypothetical protein